MDPQTQAIINYLAGQPQPAAQSTPGTDLEAFAQYATPQERQRLLALGTVDPRRDLLHQQAELVGQRNAPLERQLALANALRTQAVAPHSTPIGAALGGLGGVLNNITGTMMGKRIQGQMADVQRQQEALLGQEGGLFDQQDAGRNLYADILRRGAQSQPQPAPWLGIPYSR